MYEVARCKRGIIGIILNKKGDVYFGVTLRGKPWQSIEPEILADSVYDYITNRYKIVDNLNSGNMNTLDLIADLLKEIDDGSPCRMSKKGLVK